MGISHSLFEEKLEQLKIARGKALDTDLTASDLKELVQQYKDTYIEAKGEKFPSGALITLIREHNKYERLSAQSSCHCSTVLAIITFINLQIQSNSCS